MPTALPRSYLFVPGHRPERVVAIPAQSAGAAVALDGKMVDKPVIVRAEAVLRARRG